MFSLRPKKQLTKDPSLPHTQDHQDRKKLNPASVRRKPKNIKRKNKNPANGRVASTTNNYSVQNNETQIDFFVDRLRNELKTQEDEKIKVTGLSGKPKRSNAYWKATTKVRKSAKYGVMPLVEKLYKVGIDFSREDLSINEDMFRYNSETSYTKAVLDPLNSYLQGHFSKNNFLRAKVHKISGGLRSNGQISVWFHVWLRVSAVEVFHHLRRFRTNFMKLHPVESISLLNEMLINKNYFISSCFDDYEVQQRVFKQLEKSLFEYLQVDPIKWKNQELLYALVKKRFKTAKAEHSPSWLGQQRFDIYPSSITGTCRDN